MDRISAMRAFITVVDEGAFARAAERLDTSPQLISKYVSQLEQHLGVRLLNRTTRKVHLTEAGSRYYQRASQLLDDLDDMESQLGDMQGQAQGLLRISAPVSFATQHLAALLCDFQKAHPAVGIDVQLNDRKVDIVEEGFDVALRIGHLKSSSLIARKIASRVLFPGPTLRQADCTSSCQSTNRNPWGYMRCMPIASYWPARYAALSTLWKATLARHPIGTKG